MFVITLTVLYFGLTLFIITRYVKKEAFSKDMRQLGLIAEKQVVKAKNKAENRPDQPIDLVKKE